MPTPYERINQVITAHTPSEVVFRVSKTSGEVLSLEAVITKAREMKELTEEKALQDALAKEIEETWDAEFGRYYISATVSGLWEMMKRTILREYDSVSTRCAATKRKTEQFIRGIQIDDKHLPNYLIQVFLRVSSPAYEKCTLTESIALFEQFESLRRTYGKRDR